MTIEKNSNVIALQGDLLEQASSRFPQEDLTCLSLLTRLKSSARLLSTAMEGSFQEFDLSSGRFYVLIYLYAEHLLGRAAPSPSDIAAGLGVTRATITGLLDGLQNAGYIVRQGDASDRRALTIHLTQKAHQLFDTIVPVAARESSRLMTHLTEQERQTLSALLTKMDASVLAGDRAGAPADGSAEAVAVAAALPELVEAR